MEILIATHNIHKKEEIQQILKDFKITSLADYGITDEIEENGKTFHENAALKANFCFGKTKKNSLGDDSGLVVPALGGLPGIYSARYAGNHDFKANIRKLLAELANEQDRAAYFVTVLCFRDLEGEHFFEGRVYGKISREIKGENGFGYDPIFIPNGYDKSFAEICPDEKNRISHRNNALQKFLNFLQI